MLPDLFCADLGGTIQSIGSDSSLPNRLVPCCKTQVMPLVIVMKTTSITTVELASQVLNSCRVSFRYAQSVC